ncbi:tRNA dimethylallyltransferase [Lentibacillus sp. JNUCC-1]|uniref:tRNA (adenosine(37)-N6)-dimethylallyltransferase MiaA n=1 Tax=Lentibacillus sp. JNUCC-1 TaxID=2654513 RepID=UPI0012E86CB8|nr:tRNA (adenosine(37)-N6)-dimethylallyltransferase MiaA [Lentibacillus sp. JNUCC-1]MUV39879.1 tRNA dimethylallyltransferase [Lentibacillus sp. JNUCC-1]
MKTKIISVVGPTGVGKTELGIEIAKRFNGEIISGDAMQVYKGMDIGTAKVTPDEMQGIPHYLIDIKSPDEGFTVADFKENVKRSIDHITQKEKLPIIVGGSGLYVQSVLYDYQFLSERRDPVFTEKLEAQVKSDGVHAIYNQLMNADPEQAKKIHPNNYRRVIRALEIYKTTGLTMTQLHQQQTVHSPYQPFVIGLEMEREILYERINARVDLMLRNGLMDEVLKLYHAGYENTQSMQAIGYKELIPWIKNERSLEESTELLKRNSRRYAKRQYTWFKNKMNVHWYSIEPTQKRNTWSTIFSDLEGFLQDM